MSTPRLSCTTIEQRWLLCSEGLMTSTHVSEAGKNANADLWYLTYGLFTHVSTSVFGLLRLSFQQKEDYRYHESRERELTDRRSK